MSNSLKTQMDKQRQQAAVVGYAAAYGGVSDSDFDALIRERPRVTAIHELRALYGV